MIGMSMKRDDCEDRRDRQNKLWTSSVDISVVIMKMSE